MLYAKLKHGIPIGCHLSVFPRGALIGFLLFVISSLIRRWTLNVGPFFSSLFLTFHTLPTSLAFFFASFATFCSIFLSSLNLWNLRNLRIIFSSVFCIFPSFSSLPWSSARHIHCTARKGIRAVRSHCRTMSPDSTYPPPYPKHYVPWPTPAASSKDHTGQPVNCPGISPANPAPPAPPPRQPQPVCQ